MAERIYVIEGEQRNRTLHSMPVQPYESEDFFQALLESYPDLLNGDRPSEDNAWLLVTREMDIADSEQGSGRWSVDHLFLDRDGIPTLVEVKRSSDTRIRREVVGQMLDYAANAVLYWPVEKVRAAFEARYVKVGNEPSTVLGDFLGVPASSEEDDQPVESFWGKVKTNLEAQRVRLVFVADDIPSELQRIVEFLNGQMDPAEVIAVELKQFAGDGLRTLVPRVIGHTARAERRKPGSRKPSRTTPWTEGELLGAITRAAGPTIAETARDLIAWSSKMALNSISWGKGATIGYCYLFNVPYGQTTATPVAIKSNGTIEVCMYGIREHTELGDLLRKYIDRLNKLDGVNLPDLDQLKWKSISCSVLDAPESLREFKAIHEWFIPALRKGLEGLSPQDS